jgi:hypothetical protein
VGLRPFYDRFLASPLSHDFASGFPKIVAGTSGAELVYDVYGKKLPDIPGFASLKTGTGILGGLGSLLLSVVFYSVVSGD